MIPYAHNPLIYLNWWKKLNLANNRFVTAFHKLGNVTSPARQATHQDSDSTNASLSPRELNAMETIES
jgi:hypothetical protein